MELIKGNHLKGLSLLCILLSYYPLQLDAKGVFFPVKGGGGGGRSQNDCEICDYCCDYYCPSWGITRDPSLECPITFAPPECPTTPQYEPCPTQEPCTCPTHADCTCPPTDPCPTTPFPTTVEPIDCPIYICPPQDPCPTPSETPRPSTTTSTERPSCEIPKFTRTIYQASLPSWPIAGTVVNLGISSNTSNQEPIQYKLVSAFDFLTLSPSQEDVIFTSTVSDGAYVGPNNVMLIEVSAEVVGDEGRASNAAVAIVFPRPRSNDNKVK